MIIPTINVYIPLELSEEKKKTYQRMKELGYDMFNINDPFYQDICTPYDSLNDTDILLSDRINYIYYNDETQCQSNCKFSNYSVESRFINCSCSTNEETKYENEKIDDKFNAKKIYESFYDVLKYSNYEILKCIRFIFDKNILRKNIGGIIVILYIFCNIICLIFYLIKRISPLNVKLKEEINKTKINKGQQEKRKSKHYNLYPPIKRRKNAKFPGEKQIIKSKKVKKPIQNNKHIIKRNTAININSTHNKISHKSYEKFIHFNLENEKNNKLNSNIKELEINQNDLSDYALNELSYEEALLNDKRNVFQLFLGKIKRENIIVFTFFTCDDYNLFCIKLSRFLFLVASDMAFNAFFFSDDSMHKLYLNYGKYDFIQDIPQIVYSTIFSQLIEIFICFLSLTDKYFYEIKESVLKGKDNKTFKIFHIIDVKLSFFYLFTFIFFIFYYYVIYLFCAVYKNSQIIFLKDSFISFCTGLIYSLVLYFISSSLRICSLRNSKKYIFELSELIPFF